MEIFRKGGELLMPTDLLDNYVDIFDHAAIGMAITTLEGRYLKVNQYFCEFYGYEPHEFFALGFKDITYSEDLSVGMEDLRRLHIGEIDSFHVEKRYIHKSGEIKWGLAIISVVRDKQGNPLYRIAQIQDINERKLAKRAQKSSEELFAKAFKSNPSLMLILSMEGTILDVNDAFTGTLGYDRSIIIDKKINSFTSLLDDTDRVKVYQRFRKTGAVLNCEVIMTTKSRKERIGLLSAETIQMENQTCILVVIQDITEKKHLEREMARLERLNLIGEMAAGIGHEIRNPMTTVRGFLQIFSAKEENSVNRETFQLMIDELDRANQIISEFLSLSRDRIVDFKIANINTIIRVLYPLIYAHANMEDKRIDIKLGDISDSLVDEKELRQLILNVTRNGLEAMSAGGVLTISTYMKEGRVILMIEDQGCGIPSEIREKIGTPFFTTKDNGTGLGIAICYSIAARHKATINFESNPKGTKIFVKFN